ncbi:uncharacterized protein LOC122034791 isoform X1 [Zingiber officinale]|uniref:uncharacterized protein LOC122034791 isoform X1 n=1 Tax=Zingiber officinale TaxID=94328 RepID=UPI001C4C1BA2|nr:uncharacterized protein LOC122034791 isoform X1 [Zingiber officinale]
MLTANNSAPRMKLKLLLFGLLVFVQVKWIVAATDDTHGGKDQLHQMRHLLEDQSFHSKVFFPGLDDKKTEKFTREDSELNDQKWRIDSKRSGLTRTPRSHNSSTSMKQRDYYHYSLLPLDAFACLLLLLALT